jgi:hypothetical protein
MNEKRSVTDVRNMLDDIEQRAKSIAAGSACSGEPSGPSALIDTDGEVWVKASGFTPLEFLTYAYRNVLNDTKDRIAAAKAVLEYVHVPLAKGTKIDTSDGSFDASKLSDAELDQFNELLGRMQSQQARKWSLPEFSFENRVGLPQKFSLPEFHFKNRVGLPQKFLEFAFPYLPILDTDDRRSARRARRVSAPCLGKISLQAKSNHRAKSLALASLMPSLSW